MVADGRDLRLVADSTAQQAVQPSGTHRTTNSTGRQAKLPTRRPAQQLDRLGQGRVRQRTNAFGRQNPSSALWFQFKNKLYCYKVCHVEAKCSSFLWQRLGAAITRTIHALLCTAPHRAWLYVDDLLNLLSNQHCKLQPAVIVALMACINAPISWKKPQLAEQGRSPGADGALIFAWIQCNLCKADWIDCKRCSHCCSSAAKCSAPRAMP